jgi:choline kinase
MDGKLGKLGKKVVEWSGVWVGTGLVQHCTARVVCGLQFVCTAQKDIIEEEASQSRQYNTRYMCKFSYFSIKQREGT